MKQFKQVIKIEVSVDAIAEQLLANFKDDFKHREMVAETIIETSLIEGKLSYLYNALNGYTNEVNFKVGDVIFCSEEIYSYNLDDNDLPVESRQQVKIGLAEVVEINIYRSDKLKVKHIALNKRLGKFVYEEAETWTNHLECAIEPNMGIIPVDEMNKMLNQRIDDNNKPTIEHEVAG
jgi:hypothetical protein